MPPTPPDTTLRIKVHYTGPFGTHAMLFHAQTGQTLGDFEGDVGDAIFALANCQYNGTVWATAESAAAGSSLFFPISDWTPITSGSAISPDAGSGASAFVQFGGRGLNNGVRVKLYLFETYLKPTANMKYTPSENAAVDAVIALLQGAENNIGAIDGDVVGWYNYANAGQNDFLTHRARRS